MFHVNQIIKSIDNQRLYQVDKVIDKYDYTIYNVHDILNNFDKVINNDSNMFHEVSNQEVEEYLTHTNKLYPYKITYPSHTEDGFAVGENYFDAMRTFKTRLNSMKGSKKITGYKMEEKPQLHINDQPPNGDFVE